MTLTKRVLRHLEETRGEWGVKELGWLRRTSCKHWLFRWRQLHEVCPLESLFGRNMVSHQFSRLGSEATSIVLAADKCDMTRDGHDPALRARMLEAAGLEEAAT